MGEQFQHFARRWQSVFFSLLLTHRGRVEEKRWRAGPIRLVKLAVGFFSLLFRWCVESRSTRWWLADSAIIGLSWRKQQLVLLFLRKSQNLTRCDARDDDAKMGLRPVEGCGRAPYDHSKDSRDSVTMAPRLRTEKKLADLQPLELRL